jgi:hypothetical protein
MNVMSCFLLQAVEVKLLTLCEKLVAMQTSMML